VFRASTKTPGLKNLTDIHYKILMMSFMESDVSEICREVKKTPDQVRAVLRSDLGKDVLARMREKAVCKDAVELRDEYRTMLGENLDLPKQMLQGFVETPIFDEEGALVKTIKQRIDPELRLKALKTVADISGINQPVNIGTQNNIVTMQRLEDIKNRAKNNGVLARSEDVTFEEVD